MPASLNKLRLPQVDKVSLRRFSLFTANPDPTFDCGTGVLCLVGANGIGKSTLLSAINFCLTGIVSDPSRSFESMEEYYKFSRNYSNSYFRGRILGNDEEDAEVTLWFRLGKYTYEMRRGMFEPDELRALKITNSENEETVLATEAMPRRERHRAFMDHFVLHSGLSSFEEFVFLQHFVFTFDEQRRTIFWNQPVLERVLYRAFGMEPDMAKRADNMRREIEHEDSKVRNYQFEATRMRRRINELLAQTQASSGAQQTYDTLMTEHQELSARFEQENKALRELQDAMKDANLRLAQESLKETTLREEYAKFFDRRFDVRPPPAQHPLIIQSLTEHVCGLCGSDTKAASESLSRKASGSSCPLCDSELRPRPVSPDATRLQEIDRELARVKQEIKGLHKTLERLYSAHCRTEKAFAGTKEKLDEFDRQNNVTLESLRNLLGRNGGESSLTAYREQLGVLEHDKATAYQKRESLKEQLLRLQQTLEQQYLQAEQNFVPTFAEFAHRFLGMPLMVQMDARQATGLNLVVTVRGNPRRLQQHLSESQRFFLDIALRMALTKHMSDPVSKGGMFIDTPEGSLDIAYEKRAGDMLAMFSGAGHRIIMTANLNSSQLLLALAHRCGRSGMVLCRMTDWSELSEVQQQEESLFAEAYAQIEKAMATGVSENAPQS